VVVKMDCCTTENKKISQNGGKMDKKTILWIIIAILIVAVIYIVFIKAPASGTGQVVSSVAQSAGSGMVGGC